jgi:hypothetical protein
MKKRMTYTALSALLLVFAVLPAGCDGMIGDGDFFEAKLRGTWETHDPIDPYYRGTLVIDLNTIKITGYEPKPYYFDDPQRPFKNIIKNVSCEGYSEDGKIYINDLGWKEGIAYDVGTYPDNVKILRFNFGTGVETLRKK